MMFLKTFRFKFVAMNECLRRGQALIKGFQPVQDVEMSKSKGEQTDDQKPSLIT